MLDVPSGLRIQLHARKKKSPGTNQELYNAFVNEVFFVVTLGGMVMK